MNNQKHSLLTGGKPNDENQADHANVIAGIMHGMEENQEDGIFLKNSPSQLKLSPCENFLFIMANIMWGICSFGLIFCCGFYTVN